MSKNTKAKGRNPSKRKLPLSYPVSVEDLVRYHGEESGQDPSEGKLLACSTANAINAAYIAGMEGRDGDLYQASAMDVFLDAMEADRDTEDTIGDIYYRFSIRLFKQLCAAWVAGRTKGATA